MKSSVFPSNFLWGTATSSYQIEGAITEDGRGHSIWDHFASLPGKTYLGQSGAVAVDHYHRMEDDIALMASLGLKAYRFSVAWPRIIPDGTGPVNPRGLAFYDRLVDTLLRHGITPFVTLYHWDLPMPLHHRGGWLEPRTAYAFADYAAIVGKALGDRVDWWVTHNEPWCAAYLGYGNGVHAPGETDIKHALRAGHNLLVSHGMAITALRTVLRPEAKIGIALNLNPVYALDDRPETLRAQSFVDAFKNRWFLDPLFHGTYPEELATGWNVPLPEISAEERALITQPMDFLGINYYTRTVVRGTEHGYEEVAMNPPSTHTGMEWEIFPEGLSQLLQRIQREYTRLPIIITENGAAFPDAWDGISSEVLDPERTHYLQAHIEALAATAASGIELQGYFAWSFVDNFEWSEGYRQRFGLVYVDFASQRRIIKASGRWYARFIDSQRA